jgi:hypothetical protein
MQNATEFRRLTEKALQKASKHGKLQQYPYLQVGNQLCFSHYLAIVEADRNEEKDILIDGYSGNAYYTL